MGGDGGVIASNRRYMRGAGTADHTGDNSSGDKTVTDPMVLQEQRRRDFRTCSVGGQPLDYSFNDSSSGSSRVVACPYGRLYDKERAIQALLDKDERVSHVRGLKDLFSVRFHLVQDGSSASVPVPSCPITGKELNGLIPAYVLVPGSRDQPNVVSERGLKMKELLNDYGPVERTLRLFPPPEELEKIKEERAKEETEKKRKREKDKGKPRKKDKKGRSESGPNVNVVGGGTAH
jgi:hypothetical protein